MRKKIFWNSALIALAVLLLCSTLFLRTFYRQHQQQVLEELSTEANYITHAVELWGEAYFDTLQTDERITWIDTDGTVLYDSAADITAMGNHLDREEIRQAMETGEGQSLRTSDTMLAATLYYARQAANGTVIRVSCQQDTVLAMLLDMTGAITSIVILTLLLALAASFILARTITGPINAMDLDAPAPDAAYKELQPLVDRLQQQKTTIDQQIMELRQRQREFAAITDHMSEGFMLLDARMNVLSCNHSALLFLESEDRITNLRQPNIRPEILTVVETALSGARSEKLLQIQDTTWQIIANPVAASGQIAGAVLMVMDVTEREQREQLRREFSANVSHELKTPLTSISGFAELMQTGMVPPDKVQEFSADIYRESRRLIDLVEDIIRLSQLDENDPGMEWESIDLYDLTDGILESLRPVAERQQITLELDGEHVQIDGVWQILHEMVYNLCDNAIKYNKPGGSVTVHIRASDAVRLSVSDTGIGIPFAHQSRIFERFYRVDKSHSKQIGGTGLGLSIVRHGAQYHNARLELNSQPGQGTTVTVIF